MSATVIFQFPLGWLLAVPLLAIVALMALRQSRQPLDFWRIAVLSGLRIIALMPLVFLIAKPLWVGREPPATAGRPVMLLLDRSESMALADNNATRYHQALRFLRDRLLPALKSSELP